MSNVSQFHVLCRDVDSSSSAVEILHCLDVVSELSAGFDTSTGISTSSQSATVSRTGMLIFLYSCNSSLLITFACIVFHKKAGPFVISSCLYFDNDEVHENSQKCPGGIGRCKY